MIIRRHSAFVVLLLFIMLQLLLGSYLYHNWQSKLKIHKERQVQKVDLVYQAALDSFDLATRIYVDKVVRQPEVMQLLQQGLQAETPAAEALARGLLYRKLWPSYAELRDEHLRQIQFHRPDGRSYLRFLQAEFYDDDLTGFRPSIRHMLKTREAVSSFEAGLSLTGFRYVFPLDWQAENLGSVEMSVPFRSLQERMRQLDPSMDYYLFLKGSVIEAIIPEGSLLFYRPTHLHPNLWLEDPGLELPDSPLPPSAEAIAINQQLSRDPSLKKTLEKGQVTTLRRRLAGQTWAVNLLPITDLEGQTVAYIAAYSVDAFAAALWRDFLTNWLLGSFLLLASLGLLYRLLASREALISEKHYQQAITDSMGEGLYTLDREGRFAFINPSAQVLLGCRKEALRHRKESQMLTWQVTAPSDSFPLAEMNDPARSWKGEACLERPDGEQLDVDVTRRPLFKKGGMAGSVTLIRDISERKRAEERLLLAASVFSSAQEGIIITRPDGAILMTNDAFTQISGYEFAEVEGQNPRVLKSGRHPRSFYTQMWRSLLQKGSWQGEIWNRHRRGDEYLQATTISAVTDAEGQVLHYVGLISDITQLKQHQQELEFLAHYDPLTRLPNLVYLQKSLVERIAQLDLKQERLLVGKLDLDDFNAINDRWGHSVGDHLLTAVGQRLQSLLGQEALIARLGGDEYAFVVKLMVHESSERLPVERLLDASRQPFYVQGQLIKMTASVGLTFYPQAIEVNADQLLRQADQAMYQAKQAGKNGYQVFDAELDHRLRGQYETLSRLTEALEQEEFVLFYQPKVNLVTGAVIGVEALIRWQHPERGIIAPGQFLPVLDQQPLEIDVSHWVIQQALQQQAEWKRNAIDLPVSVNICAQHLQQQDFVEQLANHLQAVDRVTGTDLQLEILESSVLADVQHVCQVIEACRTLDVSFALDDFGTGYSSLSYLKHLPADLIKIDQSFVRDMLEDPDDLAILQGVQSLAKAFKRQVLAEGVETYQHAQLLVELGCVQAQGYGIAKPMPAEAIPNWLVQWQANPWRLQ